MVVYFFAPCKVKGLPSTNGYAGIFPAINENEIPVCFLTTNKQDTFIVTDFFKLELVLT